MVSALFYSIYRVAFSHMYTLLLSLSLSPCVRLSVSFVVLLLGYGVWDVDGHLMYLGLGFLVVC